MIIDIAGRRDRVVDKAGIDNNLAAELAQLPEVRLVRDEIAEQRRLQRNALVHGVGEAGVIEFEPFIACAGRAVRDRIARRVGSARAANVESRLAIGYSHLVI